MRRIVKYFFRNDIRQWIPQLYGNRSIPCSFFCAFITANTPMSESIQKKTPIGYLKPLERVLFHLAYEGFVRHLRKNNIWDIAQPLEVYAVAGGWIIIFFILIFGEISSSGASKTVAVVSIMSLLVSYQLYYFGRGRWGWFSRIGLKLKVFSPLTPVDCAHIFTFCDKRQERTHYLFLPTIGIFFVILIWLFFAEKAKFGIAALALAFILICYFLSDIIQFFGYLIPLTKYRKISVWEIKRIFSVFSIDHLEGVFVLGVTTLFFKLLLFSYQYFIFPSADFSWANTWIDRIVSVLIIFQSSQVIIGAFIPLIFVQNFFVSLGGLSVFCFSIAFPFVSKDLFLGAAVPFLLTTFWASTIGILVGVRGYGLFVLILCMIINTALTIGGIYYFALIGLSLLSLGGLSLAALLTLCNDSITSWIYVKHLMPESTKSYDETISHIEKLGVQEKIRRQKERSVFSALKYWVSFFLVLFVIALIINFAIGSITISDIMKLYNLQ